MGEVLVAKGRGWARRSRILLLPPASLAGAATLPTRGGSCRSTIPAERVLIAAIPLAVKCAAARLTGGDEQQHQQEHGRHHAPARRSRHRAESRYTALGAFASVLKRAFRHSWVAKDQF